MMFYKNGVKSDGMNINDLKCNIWSRLVQQLITYKSEAIKSPLVKLFKKPSRLKEKVYWT